MGWNQALWVCQALRELVAARAGPVLACNRFVDRRPVPDTRPLIHTEYVDNFVCMSQDAGLPRRAAEQVEKELRSVGLPTHRVEFSQGGTTLGWSFAEDTPIIGLAHRLRWEIRLGILEVLRRDYCSGDELRKVVAHFTARALIRRELLSALGAVYLFIDQLGSNTATLWPAVRRELRWCAAPIVLCERDA